MTSGIRGELITVQADISPGLPVFYMIGYLAGEVREAKERVRTALKNSGFYLPAKRISVNLAPADVRKYGTFFDLPIAVALLLALEKIPPSYAQDTLILGELALDGSLHSVSGVLPVVKEACEQGITRCIVPRKNVAEAALIQDMEVYGFDHLLQVIDYLIKGYSDQIDTSEGGNLMPREVSYPDFRTVKGQKMARRAIEIAAAGYHNLMMEGPPGIGKTMLASCVPGIMPELAVEEQIEVSMIYSVRGLLKEDFKLMENRPFRAPSHTITQAGFYGGGKFPKPGEISLAHKGVLFLDELPEYHREMIDMLRVPLESHKIAIMRNQENVEFPADFLLIAAANPCPCGYYPDRNLCHCSGHQIKRYREKISGPILDRIDLFTSCENLPFETIISEEESEPSSAILRRVSDAWQRQRERFQGRGYLYNGRMSDQDTAAFLTLDGQRMDMMQAAYKSFHMSPRSYFRVLKTARTIADIEGSSEIGINHLEEALLYRRVPGSSPGQKSRF